MDLIVFAGQSNMAGRGILTPEEAEAAANSKTARKQENDGTLLWGALRWNAAPVAETAGLEFRAVSDPTRLYPIEEPFGRNENRPDAIDDGTLKIGSMVSAFVQHYHEKTGRQVLAVSASKGGTSTARWCEALADDAAERLRAALRFCREQQIAVERIWVLWCQGETDGDLGTTAEQYRENFGQIWNKLREAGAQTCFLIQIGHFNYVQYPEGMPVQKGAKEMEQDGKGQQETILDGRTLDQRYGVIREVQEQICREWPDVVFAASFAPYLDEMKDQYHYFQDAYDAVGVAAAECAAKHAAGVCTEV